FELKRLFAVRLEGAEISGAAVKAMVKRLIDDEPVAAPLADDVIAGLLARQGIRIARRTVAKYRDQLAIGPARSRQRLAPRQARQEYLCCDSFRGCWSPASPSSFPRPCATGAGCPG